jgi:hypothetical protein
LGRVHSDVLHHPIGARTVELALAPESKRSNCRITPVACKRAQSLYAHSEDRWKHDGVAPTHSQQSCQAKTLYSSENVLTAASPEPAAKVI